MSDSLVFGWGWGPCLYEYGESSLDERPLAVPGLSYFVNIEVGASLLLFHRRDFVSHTEGGSIAQSLHAIKDLDNKSMSIRHIVTEPVSTNMQSP